MKFFFLAGIVNLILAVGLGAFGAHALESVLEANSMNETYQTGNHYHFYHALGLLLIGVLGRMLPSTSGIYTWSGGLLLAGIVLFSGSLYVLSVTGVTVLGVITPLGGVAFIAGWLLLAWEVYRKL